MESSGSTEKFIKYSFDKEDIECGENRHNPLTFKAGSGMRRVVYPADLSLRAGFTRFGNDHKVGYFWYKEIWFIISGTAELRIHDKRTGEKQTVQIKPNDLVYYPEGVGVEVIRSDEDLYFSIAQFPPLRKK